MNKAPVFQHRHYKAIAALFAGMEHLNTRIEGDEGDMMLSSTVDQFADMFASDNPRFDRARFLAAANGKPSNGRDKVRS